ncbi:MAG: hypothetical protein LBG77_08140 [Dysgonamonadaceae bacterium]|jgi:hypothetical protein|nr:hypothetical protein [Dysgonamonadaceae bacterium]
MNDMLRTVCVPDSDLLNVSIPRKYIGKELEIIVFPVNEIIRTHPKKRSLQTDLSFGAWADMEQSTEEICADIRNSRRYRNREIVL